MVFADDERESNPTSFKFLQMAHEWAKRSKTGGGAAPSSLFAGFAAASSASAGASQPAPSEPQPEHKDDADSDVASSDEE